MIDRRERNRTFNKGIWAGVISTLLLIALINAADAQVSSVRDSQYDWQCETQDGTLVSGHVRQDKAFQSCMNKALEDGATYIVRGGTYRVTAEGTPSPSEPPPEPPPDESPLVTFGPVTAITQYPNDISALARDAGRWEITFTLNTITGVQGLASRDEYGTVTGSHLSIWQDNGTIVVRHQDIDGGMPTLQISSTTVVSPGVEYVAVVSFDSGVGLSLHLDGVLEASATTAYSLTRNELPLTLAGLCVRCNDPSDPTIGPDKPADGEVAMAIYADPLPMPDGTAMLSWTLPTEDVENQPLPEGVPTDVAIYGLDPRQQIVKLDGEATAYEVVRLTPGEHCFVATAWNGALESADSNTACRVIQ